MRFTLVARRSLIGAVLCAALSAQMSVPGVPTTPPQRIVIGIDLSKSNPMVEDPEFAQKVAQRIAPMVATLAPRSEVRLRTFGEFDARENPLMIDRTISAANRPEEVAQLIQGVVAGVPTLISRGTIKVQNETNILAFLSSMAEASDCTTMPTTFVLATDGIESSEFAKMDRGEGLPAARRKLFEACESLVMLGLGQGTNSARTAQEIEKEWADWAKRAGIAHYEGLATW